MSDVMITVLSLSLSGSVMALILVALKPLLTKKFPKAFWYYAWLLVLARLVVPVTLPVNVMNSLFRAEQPSVIYTASVPDDTQTETAMVQQTAFASVGAAQNRDNTQLTAGEAGAHSIWRFLEENLLWLWIAGTIISLSWFVLAYAVFTRKLRKSCSPADSADKELFGQLCVNEHVKLVCSNAVTTPMFTGILRPVIVLPKRAYVADGMAPELKNILLHELTHYRRKDVLYKWGVAAVTSTHWFNPLMILIRKEISRACELSCDEAVIQEMTAAERNGYGNTLLLMSAARRTLAGIPATTFCESKEQLKERLVSIMKYKTEPKWMIIPILALALVLSGCAATLGVANGSSTLSKLNGTAYSRKMDGSIFDWRDSGCSYSLGKDGTVTLSYEKDAKTARAPLKLYTASDDGNPNAGNTGFFISPERIAIAYGDPQNDGSITVLTSGDSGATWDTAHISYDKPVTWVKLGFTTKNNGWLIACSFIAMGQEEHGLFKTDDGGKTWTQTDGNIDKVYGRMLSGAGFVNENVGFTCFRYETEFQPAICETQDGGQTWEKIFIPLSKAYDSYSKTALSPAYDGKEIVMPVLLSDANGGEKTIYLKSNDLGKTWREESVN